MMKVAYVLYPGMTTLDLVGPHDVISRWPKVETFFVASSTDPVKTELGLELVPSHSFSQCSRPDLILVPGAGEDATFKAAKDPQLVQWVKETAETATWIVSVCTGSIILAAAEQLAGKQATTHWSCRDALALQGVNVVQKRVVFDGNVVTAAGVSAGIDMALTLTSEVFDEELAKAIQLGIEYDPQPPFSSGNPAKASASTLRLATRMLLGERPLKTAFSITGTTLGLALRAKRR